MGLFARLGTAELKYAAVHQCGVACKVVTLHAWVAVMIETGDNKKRDNPLIFDPMHALGDPSEPRHIVDARLYESHLKKGEV